MKVTLIEPKAPGKHVYSNVTMPRLGLPILGTLFTEGWPPGAADHGFKQRYTSLGYYRC